MPFYKRENDELRVGPNYVVGPTFELLAESHAEYTYPIEGWYWFDDLDAAMVGLTNVQVDSVSMRQARLALHQQGMLAGIDAAVAQMDEAARIEWEYAQEIKKSHPLVQAIVGQLGWNAQQLDDLFALARTL